MRHRKDGRRLGRNSSHRKAMLRNLVSSLLLHGQIKTTETRAKELRRDAEKMITLGKKALRSSFPEEMSQEEYLQKRLHLFRQALDFLQNRELVKTIFEDYAPRYQERPGGYTRILKIGPRQGDNAPIVIIELVDIVPVISSPKAAPTQETAE